MAALCRIFGAVQIRDQLMHGGQGLRGVEVVGQRVEHAGRKLLCRCILILRAGLLLPSGIPQGLVKALQTRLGLCQEIVRPGQL